MPKGRKDGRTSKASETVKLPAPTFTISQLQQSFSQRGLSLDDLVALSGNLNKRPSLQLPLHITLTSTESNSAYLPWFICNVGGHTIGFSHCSSFQKRINNFNATHDADPSINPSFAAKLRGVCPKNGKSKNAGTTMDPSSTTFDNTYYKLILEKKGLFSSDQALLSNPKTQNLVKKFATSREAFSKAFVNSMIKMSSLTGGQEIRKNCRVVN